MKKIPDFPSIHLIISTSFCIHMQINSNSHLIIMILRYCHHGHGATPRPKPGSGYCSSHREHCCYCREVFLHGHDTTHVQHTEHKPKSPLQAVSKQPVVDTEVSDTVQPAKNKDRAPG